ncbi:Dual specificity protein phosphatase 1 [Psilocybe cubensis]|uniref:Dual specificity protein phosphatase 1 n=2 Tax=Psilocybe cubensis TaxID=181762 RepID=A0ACB8GV69_PSICU|nr:Dual specificity protein phosphatase 1 [Psilocybe cubensis]KAH9479342.1 Dual specificity protein phosphatase 1 [Psilocybe cubensis]
MVKRHKAATSLRHPSDTVSVVLSSALYLGPCSAASSESFLSTKSITQVLSVGSTPSPKVEGVVYHRLSLSDSTTSSISNTIDAATEIIKAALQSNKGRGRILVHCSAGVSRSPTIVCGYLMKEHNMSLKNALGLIVRARPQVSPNPGFLNQLKDLEVALFGSSSLDIDELPRREIDRLALFNDDGDNVQLSHTVNN